MSNDQEMQHLRNQVESLTDHNQRLHGRLLHAQARTNFWRTRYHEALDELACVGTVALPYTAAMAGEEAAHEPG